MIQAFRIESASSNSKRNDRSRTKSASTPTSYRSLDCTHAILRILFGLLVIVSVSIERASGADDEPAPAQPVMRRARVKPARVVNVVVEEQAQAADVNPKEAAVEAKAEKKRNDEKAAKDTEAADLEAVAAPLRALFAVTVAGAPNANADEAMTMQFMQQCRPVLTAELAFVRLTCSDLDPEKRPKVKKAAEESLKQAAKRMAQMQNRPGLVNQTNSAPEPRRIIRDGITKALKEALTEEQMKQFTEASNDRAAMRREAAIMAVVSRMDGMLCLTGEQRNKIVEAISQKWDEKWESWLMINSYGDMYFPANIDQLVVKHLSTPQKSVWQGLQKIDFGTWWGGNQNVEVADDWWGPDAAGEAGVNAVQGMILTAPLLLEAN